MAGIFLNNAIYKIRFPTIDRWGLVYQKCKPIEKR